VRETLTSAHVHQESAMVVLPIADIAEFRPST